jgi:hypothetical protein
MLSKCASLCQKKTLRMSEMYLDISFFTASFKYYAPNSTWNPTKTPSIFVLLCLWRKLVFLSEVLMQTILFRASFDRIYANKRSYFQWGALVQQYGCSMDESMYTKQGKGREEFPIHAMLWSCLIWYNLLGKLWIVVHSPIRFVMEMVRLRNQLSIILNHHYCS